MSELFELCWFKRALHFTRMELSISPRHWIYPISNGEVIPVISKGDLCFERKVDIRPAQFLGFLGECWEDSRIGTDLINAVLSMSG